LLRKSALALIAEMLLFAALLFGGAGTWRWPEAWIFLLLFFGAATALTIWLARHDPALLDERMKSPVQKDQPIWDRIFLLSMAPLFFTWLGVMGLDAVRFPGAVFPLWLKALRAAALLLAYAGLFRVFRENTFLAPVVKIQQGRGQHVISTGPYAVVRHPMYAFAALLLLATPILLGSLYGVGGAVILLLFMSVRIPLEERALLRGLPGYADYMRRVRYRLLPGIW
jgi:protein-S-isoprenylcysteine O-methyltransferase Ste14